VVDTKYQDPKKPSHELKAYYDDLSREIEDAFQSIGDL
jgi:hypothetical protein